MSHASWLQRRFQFGALLIYQTCCLPMFAVAEELIRPPLNERFATVTAEGTLRETPNFQRHVITLLGRLGCNGRSCHGSFQGRGGFRLSMFGYDFEQDHQALLAGDPARVNPQQPADSLILLKPTNADEHEGGKRYDKDGWEARVLRTWIASGAKNDAEQAGQLLRIEVTPSEMVFREASQRVQMRVVSVWSDGTREDVTCLTRFSSNDDDVAEVSDAGLVTSKGKGDTHIVATYDNAVDSTPVMMPVSDRVDEKYPPVATPTKIDELIVNKLRKLGVVPSDVCTDEEFLRRVSLDIAGTLPTPQQVRDFVADTSPDKRAKKIDELLETPAYALWWTTKFCDVMGLNGPLQLGNTEFGPIVTEQWRSWLEHKVRENLPYDKLVEGMVVVVSRRPEQTYEDFALQMTQYVLAKNPVDFTARDTMPHFWFRGNLATADDKALAFAYTFMGVRLDCAQCHKHPFDRWSQQDFKQFAAIFERVKGGISPESKPAYDKLRADLGVPDKLNTAAIRRQTYWRLAAEGKMVPWPEVFIARDAKPDGAKPKLLGGDEIDLATIDDPRRPLMDWLRRRDNPYFARALVNRFWAHYFGRGIVEPADDLNLGNPPSNPELFDELTTAFIEHGYDLKWLHREITRSAAYQRSWRTAPVAGALRDPATSDRNFSRAMIRRLPAEVAIDAMLMATGHTKLVDGFATTMKDRRIGVQATADLTRTEFSLAVFGKPLRNINCDCEREQQPSLAQAIFLRNDQDLHAMLGRKEGWLAELTKEKDLNDPSRRDELIRLAYLRTLSRQPSDRELTRAQRHFESAASDPRDGLRDLLWVLLNTQEFITNL
ncbi:MAG: DUF1553 domain-containing protein [Planctomycetales bacterium]|nr:DUF1553 domain-containing protein [Planctomycetales bacterium]